MTVRFRNLDFDTTQPMDRWPAEAIETVIIGWGEHYGVDALMTRVIQHAREDLTQRGRAEYATQIRSWRTASGMTLREFARVAGTSASRLSDYENAKVAPTTDVLGRLSHAAGTASASAARPAAAG
jgi:DNA-binding transcriptional regulator YiaG